MENSNIPRSPQDEQWAHFLRTIIAIAKQGLEHPESSHLRASAEVIAMVSRDALPEFARQQRERGNSYAAMRDALWDATPGAVHPRQRWTQHVGEWMDRIGGKDDDE